MKPATKEAYSLFHQGTLALARVEHNGVKIDVEYLDKTIKEIEAKIKCIRAEIESSDVWKIWKKRFGPKANLGSRSQLGEVVFGEMGYECRRRTVSKKYGTKDADFAHIKDFPFLTTYRRLDDWERLLAKDFKGLRREVVDGYLHPFFSLGGSEKDDGKGGARTYRGSSSSPNFQNIQIRDPEFGPLIRKAFIPRKGNALVEVDYGTLEWNIAACWWRDPEMVRYASDPMSDVHYDVASDCYACDRKLVSKRMRYYAKNSFVFPVLYGSYYKNCAPNLWKAIGEDLKLEDGTPLKKHLREKGIKGLGKCERGADPEPGTYEHHVKEVQDAFNERFPVFAKRKEEWWELYQKRGWFRLMTGFVCSGEYSRNNLLNYPIQGPAFHLLLKSLILIQTELRRLKLKTLVVGQIHDCVLGDVPENEIQTFLNICKRVMTEDVPKLWKWVCVPLKVEADVTPVDGTWADKAPWVEEGGTWVPKRKK